MSSKHNFTVFTQTVTQTLITGKKIWRRVESTLSNFFEVFLILIEFYSLLIVFNNSNNISEVSRNLSSDAGHLLATTMGSTYEICLGTAIYSGIFLSLVVVVSVILLIFGYAKYRGKQKSESSSASKLHSLLSDLPSSSVKSINIDTKSLNPVKSEVFEWKSTPKTPKVKKMSLSRDNIKNKVEDKRNDTNLKTKESIATKQKAFG